MGFEWLKMAESEHWEVYLHENQYYLGRFYLWAKRADAKDLMQTLQSERDDLFKTGSAVTKSVYKIFGPNTMNYASLGNTADHLHVHFIPRYKEPRVFCGVEFVDENWGKNYAPYNYDFRLPEEKLIKIRDRIKEKITL